MAREIQPTNDYREILLKLIPSEIIAAYMVIDGAVAQDQNAKWITLVVGILLSALTPVYLRRLYGVRNYPQIIVTTLSFVVWLYSLGGPFRFWGLFHGPLSSAILTLWTLIIPLVVTEKTGGRHLETVQSKEISEMQQSQLWNPGSAVVIARGTPRTVNTGSELIEWNRDMNQYVGREATVMEVSKDAGSVRLDADGGKYWWATKWIDKA